MIQPRLATTKYIQEKIIKDIKKSGIRYVVRWTDNDNMVKANESSDSSGIIELDDFIQRNFKLVQRFEFYLIMYCSSDFS